MGLKKICPYCGSKYFAFLQNRCPNCDDIDFENIDMIHLSDVEQAYRTETEEEFDIVATNFLTQLDGWQHYETKTVEYEVPDGENYTFVIIYKDGSHEERKYHFSSPFADRLLKHKKFFDIEEELEDVLEEVRNVFAPKPYNSDYETACSHFKQMQQLYRLDENSDDDDFVKATEIKMTGLIMSDTEEYNQSIYELMLFLLSTEEDGDILEIFDEGDISFVQKSEKGTDAFTVLNKGENILDKTLLQFEKIRQRDNYRKFVIISSGTNLTKMTLPNIVVWDIKNLCSAYISAFKKAVTLPELNVQPQKPKERFAVIDFETTGLNYNFRRPPMDEILSVAIIDQDGNELLYEYCDTVNIKTWYEAQHIHGISPKDVKGHPTFVEIMPRVIKILSSYDYVISYNIPFERSFLEGYARIYTPTDFSVSKIRWGDDPMEMFMNYMNSNKFLKLATAAEAFGYSYNAHNALEDAKAALHVYNALRY
ncbi:MAG: 3'-5' exonuclease [Clostridia bacterium]|nr:3'-5' exonuclease [Clostridia bacterium]